MKNKTERLSITRQVAHCAAAVITRQVAFCAATVITRQGSLKPCPTVARLGQWCNCRLQGTAYTYNQSLLMLVSVVNLQLLLMPIYVMHCCQCTAAGRHSRRRRRRISTLTAREIHGRILTFDQPPPYISSEYSTFDPGQFSCTMTDVDQ